MPPRWSAPCSAPPEIGEHTGAVIRMTTRETVLMTLDGNHVSLPNATVFKSTILNYTRNPLRRFTVPLGVGSDTDLQRVQELGLGVLRSMKGVVDDPAPIATVARLGDSSVEVRYHGWVDQRSADFLKVQGEATRLLKEVMDENGVDLPVPTYRIERASGGRASATTPSVRRERDLREEAARLDVSVQHDIGRQIDAERQASVDSDLLTS